MAALRSASSLPHLSKNAFLIASAQMALYCVVTVPVPSSLEDESFRTTSCSSAARLWNLKNFGEIVSSHILHYLVTTFALRQVIRIIGCPCTLLVFTPHELATQCTQQICQRWTLWLWLRSESIKDCILNPPDAPVTLPQDSDSATLNARVA